MDTIAEFSDNAGLTCKLTKDRFYVSSLGNEETFALRGVNGIGIYDDLEKYNSELVKFKSQEKLFKKDKDQRELMNIVSMVLFPISFIFFYINKLGGGNFIGSFCIVISIIFILISKFFPSPNLIIEPKLETYLRVILSGGERKFLFNKSDGNAVLIADFINKLEQTLTAYN